MSASASSSLWMAESPSSGIGGVRHLAGGGHFVAQRALGAERQLVLGGLAVDDVARAARRLRRHGKRRRCCALRPPRTAGRNCARRASSSASAALIMAAMMPLVSQAPRPQMCSSSSREAKKGGTVSMWVESVTASRSPHCAKTLKRRGSTSMRSTRPSKRAASGVRIVEQEVADPLFVAGDRFDIDQRARELEDVHKRPYGGGSQEKERHADSRRVFDPDSAPPA